MRIIVRSALPRWGGSSTPEEAPPSLPPRGSTRRKACRGRQGSAPPPPPPLPPGRSPTTTTTTPPPPPLLCLLLGLLLLLPSARGIITDDSKLEISDILPEDSKHYDKMRPPRSNGEATTVYFHVTVMSLDSIDEGSMTYAADIFFAQSWKDPRLRFPINMTGDYRLLPVSWLKDIWRPDSFFKNAKSVTFQTMTIPNHYIWLYQDSTILYMVKLTLLLSCAMNFQTYPHDTQQCAMKIESLSHTTDDLVFVWDPEVPLVVDETIELPQLDLVSNTTGDCTQVYSTGNFTCLEVVFTFKRRLGYYLFHTYIPTCLIVIMSWISFWIKPEAVPARVTLGVTSLLTLSTQHANSQKSLPPVSYIKAIDMFMSSCTVFVFLSLMEYALVNVVLGDMVDAKPDEGLMRKISRKLTIRRGRPEKRKHRHGPENATLQEAENGGLGHNGSNRGEQHHSGAPSGGHQPPPPPTLHMIPRFGSTPNIPRSLALEMKEAREKAILIDRFSRVMFPLSFSVLNILYWTVYYFDW
ncbi:glycine receptor subunit alpha-2-like [Oratosquilla oratoria]|uniref:glycine receptor subunit alpha-2-like n=1 Tax=Oratosquilla oratoria TaxID=337810 RepID=UPI003F7663EE